MENKLIFITGGARSGKSNFAERFAGEQGNQHGHRLYYVATSKVEDEEMKERINKHQQDRLKGVYTWKTLECPVNIQKLVGDITKGQVVLVDCLTVLLTNELFQNGFEEKDWNNALFKQKVINTILEGIRLLRKKTSLLVLVSNEIGNDIIAPDNSLLLVYQKLLGIIHQEIVQEATEAYITESGIPLLMKGG